MNRPFGKKEQAFAKQRPFFDIVRLHLMRDIDQDTVRMDPRITLSLKPRSDPASQNPSAACDGVFVH